VDAAFGTINMSRLTLWVLLLVYVVPTSGHSQEAKTVLDVPPLVNLVPDEKTAIAIAVAVLLPLYGANQIEFQKPFKAKLNGATWLVEGQLPPHTLGSVAKVQMSKDDGRIISVRHR
jgi:hypothetical protein